jgi:hypothetical protein
LLRCSYYATLFGQRGYIDWLNVAQRSGNRSLPYGYPAREWLRDRGDTVRLHA